MGTSAGTPSISPAGMPSATLVGSRIERYGRETLVCGYCGRGQFNRGQSFCIVCRRLMLISLEPLHNSDAAEIPKAYHHGEGKRICSRLRRLRMLLDVSQQEVAETAGCTRCHVTKYERGLIVPTIASLEKFAAVFRLDLAELVDERLEPEDLALVSLAREPGELMGELIALLPHLGQQARTLLLEAARSIHPA